VRSLITSRSHFADVLMFATAAARARPSTFTRRRRSPGAQPGWEQPTRPRQL